MQIGARVGVYVGEINSGTPLLEPGTVEQIAVHDLGDGGDRRGMRKSVTRYTILGDNGKRYRNVHELNVHAIVTEAA